MPEVVLHVNTWFCNGILHNCVMCVFIGYRHVSALNATDSNNVYKLKQSSYYPDIRKHIILK